MNWMSAIGLDTLSARVRAQLSEGALAAEDRIALARLEGAAQFKRLQAIFLMGILLGGLTIVALVLLSFAILVHFWDSPNRTTVAWVIAGIWVLAWIAILVCMLGAFKRSTAPFALTRAELARDWAAIKEKL